MYNDDHFMSIALRLAKRGLGNVSPNPTVGCVIVQDDVIISRGGTQAGGRPHAEVIALERAGNLAHNSTMYITLEPCCHHGNTAPCTAAIIASSIKKVVVATCDPDSRVSGKGIEALLKAGIEVKCDVMKKEAEELNAGFFCSKKLFRPFITLKMAMSFDGKIATSIGKSKWITSSLTRKWVHKVRAEHDAIMIGGNTLEIDDPMLDCRLPSLEEQSPMRIIIDGKARLKSEHQIAKTASKIKTVVITDHEPKERIKHIDYLIADNYKTSLKEVMQELTTKFGITRLLVEGGGILFTELLRQKLADRIICCRAGKILGNEALPAIGNLNIVDMSQCYALKKVESFNFSDDIIEIWDTKTTTFL
ncbi:MAG: riboflavin biosynthesis protein RibD [Candidatus Mesenet longicola]|uniref:Riboflavin biosynthesis protein RibD n=1 Tax=Candidatus Mesenet longicola TaxID=1892558 RepID=A0A8J3HPU4_9RICK|nr:MAG: riboflavin biosynthesis protein RibD [Candidatus Mesenet longicola]GHM59631.1 MAG: riboflavin biosynthesis protein RibD [Candidatus Mesenet longicola]